MATAYNIGTFGQDAFSDLVLGYVKSTDIGFSFLEMALTKTATLQVGSVVTDAGVEAAAAADAFGVFAYAGLNMELKDIAVGEVFTAVVAVRAATLNRYKIFYVDGSLIDDAGALALEAKGLKVTDKLLKTS